MPCGGIYQSPYGPDRCKVCDGDGGDLYVEEWDYNIHYACLGRFLASADGTVVLAHGHAIAVEGRNGERG